MAEHGPIRKRWIDQESDDEVANILRRSQPPPLSPVALRRIETRVAQSLQSERPLLASPPPFRLAFTATLLLLVGVGMGLGISELAKRRLGNEDARVANNKVDSPSLSLPKPVSIEESPRLVFVGSGEAVLANAGGTPRLVSGTLLIKTEGTLAVISAPHCEVRVDLHSITEIAVHKNEVVVGTHTGKTVIEWHKDRRQVTVESGTAATQSAVYPLPKTRMQELAPFLEGRSDAVQPVSLSTLVAPPRHVSQLPPPEKTTMVIPQRCSPLAMAMPTKKSRAPERGPTVIPDSESPQSPRTPVSPPPAETEVPSESQLLNDALAAWRKQKDPVAALRLVEDYAARFPQGVLHPEADFLRVRLFLELHRPQEALAVLDKSPLSDETPRSLELRVLRGELRQSSGRCAEAIADFSDAMPHSEGGLQERAVHGRYRCHLKIGNIVHARGDREYYLRRFPKGRYFDELRRETP